VAAHEQGLAGGLINTSFQLGGALVLAVVTAVVNASTTGTSSQSVLDGYHAAIVVPLIAAALGAVAMVRRPSALSVPAESELEEALEEAA